MSENEGNELDVAEEFGFSPSPEHSMDTSGDSRLMPTESDWNASSTSRLQLPSSVLPGIEHLTRRQPHFVEDSTTTLPPLSMVRLSSEESGLLHKHHWYAAAEEYSTSQQSRGRERQHHTIFSSAGHADVQERQVYEVSQAYPLQQQRHGRHHYADRDSTRSKRARTSSADNGRVTTGSLRHPSEPLHEQEEGFRRHRPSSRSSLQPPSTRQEKVPQSQQNISTTSERTTSRFRKSSRRLTSSTQNDESTQNRSRALSNSNSNSKEVSTGLQRTKNSGKRKRSKTMMYAVMEELDDQARARQVSASEKLLEVQLAIVKEKAKMDQKLAEKMKEKVRRLKGKYEQEKTKLEREREKNRSLQHTITRLHTQLLSASGPSQRWALHDPVIDAV